MTLALKNQEEYSLGSLTVKALHTPCHTRGHVLFYVTSAAGAGEAPSEEEGRGGSAPLVFSGDTLFVGGCGRFFEGDASQSKSQEASRVGIMFVLVRIASLLRVESCLNRSFP